MKCSWSVLGSFEKLLLQVPIETNSPHNLIKKELSLFTTVLSDFYILNINLVMLERWHLSLLDYP